MRTKDVYLQKQSSMDDTSIMQTPRFEFNHVGCNVTSSSGADQSYGLGIMYLCVCVVCARVYYAIRET